MPDTYTPQQMAAAILALPQGGAYQTEELTITQNSTTTAPTGKAYNKVVVIVPNTYSAGDEGKVVDNGALVAQTAHADVTPTTSDQTIDTTLNNSLKVKGDANLVAENIKKDVVIFGVTGTYDPAPTPTGHTVTFSVYNGDKETGYGEAYFKFDTVPSSNSDYDFHVYGGYDGASPNVYGSIVPGGEEDYVEDGSQYTGTGQTLYCWGNSLYAHVTVNGSDITLGTWQSPTVIQLSANTAVSVTADSFDD